MTDHLQLIATKLGQLARMRGHLKYSAARVRAFLKAKQLPLLTPQEHESLAAFRVRFSEFQEHLGKAMRAIAIEEEADVDRFGSVLAFMERLQIIDNVEHWKLIRELRNAVNHEYEDNPATLSRFIEQMLVETAALFDWHQRLQTFCTVTYHLDAPPAP